MPFNLRETIGGFNHLRMRWQRQFLGRPADYYLRELEGLNAVPSVLRIARAEGTLCPICGYALARFEVLGGFLVETCSASQAKEIVRRGALRAWWSELPAIQSGADMGAPAPRRLDCAGENAAAKEATEEPTERLEDAESLCDGSEGRAERESGAATKMRSRECDGAAGEAGVSRPALPGSDSTRPRSVSTLPASEAILHEEFSGGRHI